MALTQPPSSCSFLQSCREERSGSDIPPLPLETARRAGAAAGAAVAPAGQSGAGQGWAGLGRAEPARPAQSRPPAAGGPGAPGCGRSAGSGAVPGPARPRGAPGDGRCRGTRPGGPRRRPAEERGQVQDGRRGESGAAARRGTLPDGEGAQGLLRPFLTPLSEEAALSSTGAAFPRQFLPAGQRGPPAQLWDLLVSAEKRRAERERTAEDAVPHGSFPVAAAAAAGAVQPGYRELSFSLLRVL